jgi:hypothetical protein
MKKCTQCNKEKELNGFYIDRGAPDNRRSKCKDCMRKLQLNNNKKKREEIKFF